MLGISILVTVLLDKYLFYRPAYRLLADWRSHGLDLSLGTLTDGLKRMVPLLEPVYEALVKRSQGQRLWHADETRWLATLTAAERAGAAALAIQRMMGILHMGRASRVRVSCL